MNVKVSRTALIAKLNSAIAIREAEKEAQKKRDAEYEKARKKREDDILKAVKSGKAKVTDVHFGLYNSMNRATVTFELPEELSKPIEREWVSAHPSNQLDELRSAVALLELSDETTVSASAYKNVAQYIA